MTTICPQCGVHLDALTTTCGACGAVITAGGSDGERTERVRAKLQDAIGDAFVLGDMLGRGGMGIVFRAREKALDRDVALKVLAFDPVLNPEAYARFEREAKLAAKLDHPNIVPIFSVGQRNAIAFYTMRMVKGGSVEQMVTPGRGLDVPHAINILRDVASALDYAHANGVVHRDIKPANILIGDSGHALVADFGIARAFGGDGAGSTATGTGIVGSPAYMSPEQWRGEKVDGRADQYALGVLAFELLSGRRPFADASMQELLRMHLAEDPPDIISFRQDLPSHVTDVIWGAMAKSPADRYPTTTSFVNALEGDPGSVTTGPRVSAARPGADGARKSATVSGMKATVKQVTPLPSSTSARPSRTAQRLPAPRRSESLVEEPLAAPAASHRTTWLIAGLLVVVGALGALVATGRGRVTPETAAPPVASSPPNAVGNDSLIAMERAQAEENLKLQKEVTDARRTALEAERKMEQMATAQRAASSAKAPPAAEPHAHVFVMVQGGTPAVLVDGVQMADKTPAVIEVKPGRHLISVAGGGAAFQPAEYSADLVVSDTQTFAFMSRQMAQRRAQQQQLRQQQGRGRGGADPGGGDPGASATPNTPSQGTNAPSQSAAPTGSSSAQGKATSPASTTTPQSPDPSKMTADQRQRYQAFLRKQAALQQQQKKPQP
ncbi:MAG: protein kinase [Gemmatimonadales bacterium]